jgi:hypothetical protein
MKLKLYFVGKNILYIYKSTDVIFEQQHFQ